MNFTENIFRERSNFSIEKNSNDLSYTEGPSFLKAIELANKGVFQKARVIFLKLLVENGAHENCLRWLGYCFQKEHNFEEALKYYEKLYLINPSWESLYLIGESYYQMGQDEKALKFYEITLEQKPHSRQVLFEIYKNMGNIFVRSGCFLEAEENYETAQLLNPQSDTLFVNKGTLEIQKSNWERAKRYFIEALDINSNNDKAWVGLSLLHREMGDKGLAIGAIERSLDANSNNQTALQLLVDWSLEEGDVSHCIERLMIYLSNNWSDVSMSLILAKIFCESGDLVSASLELERVLSLDPKNEEGIYLLDTIRKIRRPSQ